MHSGLPFWEMLNFDTRRADVIADSVRIFPEEFHQLDFYHPWKNVRILYKISRYLIKGIECHAICPIADRFTS